MPIPLNNTLTRLLRALTRNNWLRLKASLVMISALLLLAIWTATLQRSRQEEALVITNARTAQLNLAIIVSENLRQVLDRGNLYALVAADWMNSHSRSSEVRMSAMLAGDRAYNRMVIHDPQGKQLYASSPATRNPAIRAALDRFIADSRGPAPPSLRVARISGAFGESWHLPMLLRMPYREGALEGVLELTLDLGYLLRLYQDIDIGRTGIIQILSADGEEIIRGRRGGIELGHQDSMANPLAAITEPQGSLEGVLFGDGQAYEISFQRLESHPFTVAVSQEREDLLAAFQARKARHLTTISILTVIVVGLTAWGVLMIRRQRLYFEATARSEEEKRALIDQLEEEKRRAYELASHDHLTGLANRRMFMELGASHLARARRSRHHYALMFVDLDRFKAINDSLGHRVGDLLLQVVGQRLKQTLRASDVIGRFGGDEFVVLLTGLEQETDVVEIATKLVKTIAKPCTNLDGHDVQIGPSIGVALYPRDGQDLDTLIRHADAAMYQSKKVSRGTFTFFDPALNVNRAHEFDLEQRLPKAIAEDELVLHYQPKVDLQHFRVVGFEALVRWQHPEHGLIYPGDFIPMAEGTGQIVSLGNWVLEAACRQLAAWQSEGLPLVPVAVNLSARQLRESALADRILNKLAEHALKPSLLQVEVTESSLVENIEIAGGILDDLVKAGISVALDDFGNGFSSLGYIKTLPIDTIKIDRTFVKDIINSPDDAIIVESTIILAHNLGMHVIAEGIETRDQLMHLKTAGCDEVQGYYFSRPIPAAEARGMLLQPTRTPA
jgi:diguanylate cyclase (GGDEF)-like protein